MTLIEVLLGLLMAFLVVALVYSVYHTVTSTLAGQQRRESGPRTASRALARLARDLECAFAPAENEVCGFALQAGGSAGAGPELSFCTLELPEDETDERWFEAVRVTYRGAAGPDGLRLLRESQPVAGPGASQPPATNEVARGIERFAVTLFDGGEWRGEWPAADAAACPRAARIELILPGGRPDARVQTTVLIPAGILVTSRVERAVAR